jgi:virginiamycin B lyase
VKSKLFIGSLFVLLLALFSITIPASIMAASVPAVAGKINEYALSNPNALPCFITHGSKGNLWFTGYAVNMVWRLTPTGTFTGFTVPTAGGGPFMITPGPNGKLWYTELNVGKIGKITTS